MARRRSAGGFNTASNLIQMYIQDQMERERAGYEDQLARGRQSATMRQQLALQMMNPIAKGEVRPDALGPEGLSAATPYYDPTKLAPTHEQQVGGVVAPILGKSKYEDIPTDDAALQALFSGANITDMQSPIVQQGIQAIKARANSLKPFIPTKSMPFMGEDGVKQNQEVPVNEIAGYGALPQERTGQQEGSRDLATALAGNLSPEMTAAKVGQTNQVNLGTMGSEARKAGAVSNATAMGSNANNVNDQKFDLFQREEAIRQKNAVDLRGMPTAGAQKNAGAQTTLSLMLQRVQELNNRLPEQGFIGRMTTGAASMLGIDTDAADMDNAAESGGMLVAQALQPQGPYSDADAKAGSAFFPKSHQSKELRDRMISRLEDIVNIRPTLEGMFGPNFKISDPTVSAVLQQMLNQRDAQRGLPPLPEEEVTPPPSSTPPPSMPGVVIRKF